MSRKNIIIALILCCSFIVYGQEGIKLQQKNAIYHNKKGWESLQAGNAYSAIVSFQSALSQNPKYKESLLGLGYAYVQTQGYNESIKLFDKVLKLYPDNEQAIMGMAKAYTGLGRYKEAMKLYDRLNELSYANNESRFGMAYLYYKMGKMLWAKRLCDRILQNDPYYYDALLLYADIKAKDKRVDDAIDFVKKAIDAKDDYPDAFVKLAEMLYLKYVYSGDSAYLLQATDELQKALVMNKTHLQANRDMGFLLYVQGNYQNAITCYESIVNNYPYIVNNEVLYNAGLMYELTGNIMKALEYYTKALSKDNLNSMIAMKIRQLSLLEHIKIGHPVRIQSSNDDFASSQELRKKGFPDLSMLFLRLSLALNPNNSTARQELLRIYETSGYFELYYDEIKKMHSMNPTQKSQDLMSIAVFQRRDKLFFKLGYDKEEIPRDVPEVLVLDFTPDVPVPAFADAGSVFANSINFAMGQFGRYQNFPMSQRLSIIKSLSSNNLDDILKNLNDKMNNNEIPRISYLLYGEYNLSGRYIECNAKLMDAKTGVVIAHFTESDNSKYSTHTISINLAKKMYDTIPFRGKIISYSEDMAVINLGTIDGIETGALLETYVENEDTIEQDQLRKKVVFKVSETGTLISLVKPVNPKDIDLIAKGSDVFPVNKKRAKKIK
ncbi:MAG TPA: tetratricopeptide repeat protein [Spirochaetota bacterium]|nr:tetratricopeptide repeat protein [Spirochaetota bacterium]HPD04655.1 tetratricopeptide repeat protein [Spirochaetota bacterium]HRR61435.1 tetratricopeptide repeat protein [Spirochaetota bacterium]HRV14523.1 tetratricopeptide repeat protein [Spirochaetota bacterium]